MPLGGRGTSSRRCVCCGCSCDFGFVVWAVCAWVCDWEGLPPALRDSRLLLRRGLDAKRLGRGGGQSTARRRRCRRRYRLVVAPLQHEIVGAAGGCGQRLALHKNTRCNGIAVGGAVSGTAEQFFGVARASQSAAPQDRRRGAPPACHRAPPAPVGPVGSATGVTRLFM